MKRNKDIDKESLNELIHLAKSLLRVTYVITIVGIVLGAIILLQKVELFKWFGGILKVIAPLFIGFIIAWLFYPLQKKMLDKGMNKVLSALIIFLGIVGIIFIFIYVSLPVLYDQVNDLISFVPNILERTTGFVSNWLKRIDIKGIDIDSLKTSLISTGETYIVSVTSSLPNGIISVVKSLFSGIGVILISLVIGIYMLIDFDNIIMNFYKLLPKKNRKDYIDLFNNIGVNARKVVNGTLLVAFMVFICDTIGFALIGLNASILFGLLCGITDLIPYIGPYIGGAIAVIVGFTQSPIIGIGCIIIAVIVQLLESYILQPVVMSKAMQLHPVTIIVSLLLFGYFFGIPGMILATPLMAIIKEIWIFIYHKIKGVEYDK